MQTRTKAPSTAANSADDIGIVAGELRNAFADLQTRLDTKLGELDKRAPGASVEDVRAELAPHAQAVADLQEQMTRIGRPQNPGTMQLDRNQEQTQALGHFLRSGDPSKLVALGAWRPDMATRAVTGTEQVQPQGGYVVLPTIDTNIDRIERVVSPIVNFVRNVSIGGREYVRHVKQSGAVFTPVASDSGDPAADAATYREIRINSHEHRGAIEMARSLLNDAYYDVGAEVARDFGEGRALAKADQYVNGTGVGQAKGMLSANNSYSLQTSKTEPALGTIGYVKTGSTTDWGATATTKVDVFQQVIARLKPQYLAGANFFMNRTSISQVMLFKDANGQLLWVPSLLPGNAATLRAYPVQNIEEFPDGASGKFPAAFGNLAEAYTGVDTVGLEILPNPYRTTGIVRFEAFIRFGGGFNKTEAFKPIRWEA